MLANLGCHKLNLHRANIWPHDWVEWECSMEEIINHYKASPMGVNIMAAAVEEWGRGKLPLPNTQCTVQVERCFPAPSFDIKKPI